MSSRNDLPGDAGTTLRNNGFACSLVRVWFNLVGRKIRLLGSEKIPDSGPTILAVSHAPTFNAALSLVAASERPVSCLLDIELGFWRRSLAGWLGMILCEPESESREVTAEAIRERRESGATLALFRELNATPRGDSDQSVPKVPPGPAELGIGRAVELGIPILPVHIFMPQGDDPSGEVLIHIGSPLKFQESSTPGKEHDRARNQATALDMALGQNAFSLMERELNLFLADLEEVLTEDLEEDWAARPDWKQKTEGFKLSQFLADCVEHLNSSNPAQVVALRNKLETCKESRRRWSLDQAEVEAASSWLEPAATRLWYWFESIVGLPIAFCGFVNHLLAWGILSWRGLLKKENVEDTTTQWFLRGLVVVGCYAAQIGACAFVFGRATAGYYALTLPLVGLFLWRYRWLVRARTRLLFLAARLPRGAEKVRRQRKQLISEIDTARDAYAQAVGVIH